MPNVHLPSLDSVGAGAPEAVIEITPEMIEAGVLEFGGDCDRRVLRHVGRS
jgi:hypothetical protein